MDHMPFNLISFGSDASNSGWEEHKDEITVEATYSADDTSHIWEYAGIDSSANFYYLGYGLCILNIILYSYGSPETSI
jgi:hypothetical protein